MEQFYTLYHQTLPGPNLQRMNPPLLTKCLLPDFRPYCTALQVAEDYFGLQEVLIERCRLGGWLDLYLPGRSARLESIIAFRRRFGRLDC